MRVDQARHDPLAGGVDDVDGLAVFEVDVGRQRADALDPIALDDDGIVAARRLAGAVDQRAVADHQGLLGGAHCALGAPPENSFALPTLYNVAVIRRGAGRGAKNANAPVLAMHRHPSRRSGNGSSSTPRYAKPNQAKPQARKWSAGRRQSVAAPRGRMLPPARAPGAARATERPLAGIVCFGRAAPPGAPPRSAAPAVDRRSFKDRTRSAGSLFASGVL